VGFSCERVQAGQNYVVGIPRFRGQTIDIAYELKTESQPQPAAGVVGRWCKLDESGEAEIAVPADHPEGDVCITQVRSRTAGTPWYPAGATIHVARGGA
jgi:hypothetical protein